MVVIQKSHEDMTRGLLLEERLAVLEGDIGETNHLKSIKLRMIIDCVFSGRKKSCLTSFPISCYQKPLLFLKYF